MELYGYRNGRTLRALWALEEVGAAYEYVEVDIMGGQGREPGRLFMPWALAVDSKGSVHVLDSENHRVQRIAF